MSEMINAEDYKPKIRGKSDFFSWRLYQWLKKHPYYYRVYLGTWNSLNGIDRNNPIKYIGFIDDDMWFHGKQLNRLCINGTGYQPFAFYPSGFDIKNWKDITEKFYKEYSEIGVCAIHSFHNFKEFNDYRICEYCNEKQLKKEIMIPKITWVTV